MRGQDEAFTEFALGQAPALRRLAYGLVGDWHGADDLVQGTFERAFVHWRRVRSADEPAAYPRCPSTGGRGDAGSTPSRTPPSPPPHLGRRPMT